LPLTVLDLGAYKVEVTSGTLLLVPDSTYTLESDYRILDSGNIRTAASFDGGRWNLVDDSITLASTQDETTLTGIVAGDSMTLHGSSRVLVLRK
jgi:hypothetical protein